MITSRELGCDHPPKSGNAATYVTMEIRAPRMRNVAIRNAHGVLEYRFRGSRGCGEIPFAVFRTAVSS